MDKQRKPVEQELYGLSETELFSGLVPEGPGCASYAVCLV